MSIFNEAITWLTTKKESSVTDTTATTAADTTAATTDASTTTSSTPVAASTTTTTTATTEPSTDSVLSKVKELLINIGHDVDTEWDELVALAKKLVTKSS